MVPTDRTRSSGYKLKHMKLHLNTRKCSFYCEGSQRQEQIGQRGCGVPTLRNIQNPHERVRGTVLEQNARIGDHHSWPRLGMCAFSGISKSVGRWRLTEHRGQGQTRSGRWVTYDSQCWAPHIRISVGFPSPWQAVQCELGCLYDGGGNIKAPALNQDRVPSSGN